MSQQTTQVGNSATGFSNNFMQMMGSLLGTPNSGAAQAGRSNPVGSTMSGAGGILSSILSPGAGQIGGALATQLAQQQQRDVQSLNERFSAYGGTSLGTPAGSSVAQYKAQAAPNIMSAIGNLQLGAISPLLSAGNQLAYRGVTTPQQTPNPFMQILSALPGIGSGVGSILGAANMGGGGGMQSVPWGSLIGMGDSSGASSAINGMGGGGAAGGGNGLGAMFSSLLPMLMMGLA